MGSRLPLERPFLTHLTRPALTAPARKVPCAARRSRALQLSAPTPPQDPASVLFATAASLRAGSARTERSLRGPQAAVSDVAVRPARSAVSGCSAHPCPARSRSQHRGAVVLAAEAAWPMGRSTPKAVAGSPPTVPALPACVTRVSSPVPMSSVSAPVPSPTRGPVTAALDALTVSMRVGSMSLGRASSRGQTPVKCASVSWSLKGVPVFAVTGGSVPAWWAAPPASSCPLGPSTAAPPVPRR